MLLYARWAEPLPSGAGPLTPHVLAPKPKKTYMPLEGSKKSRRNSRSRSPNSRRGSRSAESSSSKKNEFQMRHVNIDQLRAAMIVEKAFRRYMGQKMAKMRCRQVGSGQRLSSLPSLVYLGERKAKIIEGSNFYMMALLRLRNSLCVYLMSQRT